MKVKEQKRELGGSCQYYYPDMTRITLPDTLIALPLRKLWWTLKVYISVLGPHGFASKIIPYLILSRFNLKKRIKFHTKSTDEGSLNLQPGEWVEVRPVKEILATLDAQGKLKGLRFTPEMVKFCGKRFKVYKRLDKIILETTGKLRKIKTPTVLLEGVFCDGKAHGGCDRSCFCFWREAWLKRVTPQNPENTKQKHKFSSNRFKG